MPRVARFCHANANRAREALRVMEEAARFALNDASLCESLKTLRHDLRKALDGLPHGWLEAKRETPDDVGTSLSTYAELRRANLVEVVIAAAKRLSESLRVMEETGKTLNITFSSQIESLRYRAYDLESRLQMRLGTGRARQWNLCLLLTESLCHLNWREVVEHDEVDTVLVATPDALHYEQVMACARAGKHVICEKPVGLNVAQAHEMWAACREATLADFVPFWTRYAPIYRRAREIFRS